MRAHNRARAIHDSESDLHHSQLGRGSGIEERGLQQEHARRRLHQSTVDTTPLKTNSSLSGTTQRLRGVLRSVYITVQTPCGSSRDFTKSEHPEKVSRGFEKYLNAERPAQRLVHKLHIPRRRSQLRKIMRSRIQRRPL